MKKKKENKPINILCEKCIKLDFVGCCDCKDCLKYKKCGNCHKEIKKKTTKIKKTIEINKVSDEDIKKELRKLSKEHLILLSKNLKEVIK